MVFGAILAGGVGARMNISSMPKQFLMLGEKPIIIHTLEKMLLSNKIDKVFVGVHSNWISHTENILKKYIVDTSRVHVVKGGKDRNGTIMNIIGGIEEKYGASDKHIIVTHDAVRPFVTIRILEEHIEMATKYGACDTVIKSTDTIVESKDGKNISDIPDRSILYQGQTPQSFNVALLKRLYQDLNDQERKTLTDACKICVINNIPVALVKGETLNVKITTTADYRVAQAIVGGKIID